MATRTTSFYEWGPKLSTASAQEARLQAQTPPWELVQLNSKGADRTKMEGMQAGGLPRARANLNLTFKLRSPCLMNPQPQSPVPRTLKLLISNWWGAAYRMTTSTNRSTKQHTELSSAVAAL